MTTLAYRFLAGRYHATPWGAHVNEGLVEWPPSPFRLLRGLIATGFSRFGWTCIEGAAKELFELLSAAPPSYALPEGTASHTRHYMPPFSGSTTKVIDAFLRFPNGSTLYVRYATDLSAPSKRLLSSLLRAQPYLGRAEAWIEGEVAEDVPEGLVWTEPSSQPPGPGFERVELLACEESGTYRAWRDAFMAGEIAKKERDERQKAEAKGKPFKGLPKKERDKIEERLPLDVVAALLQDTGTLRKEGWSQPPGTRWVSYFRESEALVPRLVAPPRKDSSEKPTTALLALSSDTANADAFPPIADAVWRLEALHDALVRRSEGPSGPSACFTGRAAGETIGGHQHATLVPLTLGRRKGRIDHVLVHCPMGFDDQARDALFRLRKTWAKNLPDLFVALAGLGTLDSFAETIPLLRPSRLFRSATPFVPSRFLKSRGHDALFAQVQRELSYRGLHEAAAIEIEVDGGRWVSAARAVPGKRAADLAVRDGDRWLRPSPRFRRFVRARASRPPPALLGLSLRITFAEPTEGPLALGYASHFGLGVFSPTGP
jgi:CRISPR-associated protein Csb2